MPTVVDRNRASSRPESRSRSRPPTCSPPELGRSSPPSRLSNVDFPDPDLPRRRYPLAARDRHRNPPQRLDQGVLPPVHLPHIDSPDANTVPSLAI